MVVIKSITAAKIINQGDSIQCFFLIFYTG